jgi:hypothetical protein
MLYDAIAPKRNTTTEIISGIKKFLLEMFTVERSVKNKKTEINNNIKEKKFGKAPLPRDVNCPRGSP